MKKFCLLDYTNTANLGDEIQSIAARRFLPQVDRYVDREALNDVRSEDGASYWMIMNGWFCHRAENWPPSRARCRYRSTSRLRPESPAAWASCQPKSSSPSR